MRILKPSFVRPARIACIFAIGLNFQAMNSDTLQPVLRIRETHYRDIRLVNNMFKETVLDWQMGVLSTDPTDRV